MLLKGFVLIPLYIYPTSNQWDPLFTAASAHPTTNFLAVINPDNGPGAANCPNSDYLAALEKLHSHANIFTLGYVHTASKYNCGPYNNYICPATETQQALQQNITKYQNWSLSGTTGCSQKNISLNGIFFDESPTDSGANVAYMRSISTFTKNTMKPGAAFTLFNMGVAPEDAAYWGTADFINVFEGTQAAYDDIPDNDTYYGNGLYREQATIIIHGYEGSLVDERADVDELMSPDKDGVAGVYVTERTTDLYSFFPQSWAQFCGFVDDSVPG